MRGLLIALNAALVLAIVGVALFWHPAPEEAPLPGTYAAKLGRDVMPPGGDFTLDGPDGPVALRDYRGKLVLLYFGYTYCPDICPTSLAVWATALGALSPAELARVQPLFISVDPERDTVARLAEYAPFFHPSIQGLTGTLPVVREIAERYGAVFARQEGASASGYVIDHTSQTQLIDAAGRLVDTVPHGATAPELLERIRRYLPPP